MLPLTWISAPPIALPTRPLRRPGSLTARLARSGRVSVDVLSSGWQVAHPDEAKALGLARPGRRVFVREVCVRKDGRPAVLARSVTTAEGLHRAWRGLRTLGRQPLATLLWSDPRIRRGRFEYARLAGSSSLARAVGVAADLPARRSCFWRDGQPLIVMEAFAGLPWPAVAGLPPRRR